MTDPQRQALPPLYSGADASVPGSKLPPGTKIVAGYVGAPDLGGIPDTPHVWSAVEWNFYLDPGSPWFGGNDLRAAPIYTHDYPGDPAADAINAADAVTDLGWKAGIGRIIWWDAEMLIDPVYTRQLNQEVQALGFRLGKYGTAHTVNSNPPVDGGSWIAALQPARPRALPAGVCVGQQWQFGKFWNLDVFSQFVYNNCGRGPRKTVA